MIRNRSRNVRDDGLKDITTYIFGANQEYFIPETDTQFHNSDIGKKLKEMIQ